MSREIVEKQRIVSYVVTSRKLNTHKNVRFDPFVVHRYIRCRRRVVDNTQLGFLLWRAFCYVCFLFSSISRVKRTFHHSFLALIIEFHRTVMGCAHALVSCFKRDKRIHGGSGWDIPGDRTEPPAMVLHSKKILRERYCNDGFFWDRFRWGSAI